MSIRYLSGIDVDANTLFVDSANNRVGIGTGSPTYTLDVVGSIRSTGNEGKVIINSTAVSGKQYEFISIDTGNLGLYDGTSYRLWVSGAGNVGIGTTSPAYKLDVNGNIRSFDGIRNEASHSTTLYENILPAVNNGGGTGIAQMAWWVSEPNITWDWGGFGYNVINDGGAPYGFSRRNTSFGQAYMRMSTLGDWYFYNTNTSGTRVTTMTLTNAGNVGIGTTAPSARLHVSGGDGIINTAFIGQVPLYGANFAQFSHTSRSGADQYSFLSGNAGDTYVNSANSESIFFRNNNNNTLAIITAAGNVGIGTTAPATKFHVEGGTVSYGQVRILSTSGSGGEASIHIGRTDQTLEQRWTIGQGVASIADSFGFYTGGSVRMTLTTGGNVGIGTTAPAANAKLTIDGSAGANTSQIDMVGFSSTAKGHLGQFADSIYLSTNYYYSGGQYNDTATLGQAAIVLSAGATSTSFIDFNLSDAGANSPSNKVRITSSGNVGIGTTAPDSLLHISGSGNTFTRYTNTTSAGHYVDVGANSAGQSFIYSYGAYPLLIGTNATTQMTVLSAGNVGIGTTSPLGPLEVYRSNTGGLGGHIIVNNNGTAVGNETAVIFGDGASNGFRAAISSTTENSPYYGDLKFKTGANVYSSLTTKMIITGAGNVGIGTTAPAQKFEVYGDEGQPATSGTTQNGMVRFRPGSTEGWGEALDFGMHIGVSGPASYAWLQATNAGGLGINYNIAINPNGGNVGIGTTAPAQKLHVNGVIQWGGGTSAPFAYSGIDGGGLYIEQVDSGINAGKIRLQTRTNNTGAYTQLSIDADNRRFTFANGDVGIGTTSPGALLHVAGVPRFDASGGAPSDTSAPVTQNKYYGTNSVVLTSPNNWLKVDINGTAYVIPAYSI